MSNYEIANMDYLDLVDEFMEYLDECEKFGKETGYQKSK